MKKAFFVSLVFIISLLIATLALALLFLLSGSTNNTAPYSFRQFGMLLLQVFPLAVLLAYVTAFVYALKKEALAGLSALLLAPLSCACIWIFSVLCSRATNASFILSELNFSDNRMPFYFLRSFFPVCSDFFNDMIALAQRDIKLFLLFSGSFWLAVLSYFLVALNCSNWKLLNFIFMLVLTLGSFYLYPIVKGISFQIIFDRLKLPSLKIMSAPIVFFAISFCMFLFCLIRFAVKKRREKQRSRF